MPAIKIVKTPAAPAAPVAARRVALVSDLTVPPNYSLQTSGISQSMLGNYQQCRRKYLLGINRWTRPGNSIGLDYGTMVHEMLDRIYTNFSTGVMQYPDLSPALTKWLDEYRMPSGYKPEEEERWKANAQAILERYLIHYQTDFTELRFEEVEGKFELQFHGYTIRGKKDGRFRDKVGGSWHIEHKNYAQINEENMLLHLAFDLQNLFYLLADRSEHKRSTKGVLYNVLRRPDVRKSMGVAEQYQYVTKLIKENPDHYFKRYEVPYTLADLNEFERTLIIRLDELYSQLKDGRLDVFYKNECACEGKYTCEYLAACATGKLNGYIQRADLFPELV